MRRPRWLTGLRLFALIMLVCQFRLVAPAASLAAAPAALQFNGTNAYVQVGDSASLRIPTNLTVEAWIRPTAVSGHRHIVGKGNYELAIEPLNGGFKALFEFAAGGNWRSVVSGQFALNQWYHVAGSYDGATMRLFVNGAQVATTATSGNIDTTANPLYIGTVDLSGDYFAGTIDEVRVSSVVRYTGNFTVSPTPFVADTATRGLWHLDEGSGATAADASSYGNTGTLLGGAAWTTDTPVSAGGTAPPVISAVGASGITSTAATIAWTTDRSATSAVEYGQTTAYGASSGTDLALVTAHAVTLNGLTAGTTYHYRVISQDAGGNRATSGDFTFATASGGTGGTTQGEWAPLMTWPVEATNMVLLYTGEILMWEPWELPASTSARLWNPTTQTFTSVPSPTPLFCSAAATMADGRVIMVGGHAADNIGIKTVTIFDPATRQWSRAADLNLARWYAGIVPLADGRILALGGLVTVNVPADPPEVYDPATNTWTLLSNARLLAAGGSYPNGDYLYPLSYLLPDGRVLTTTADDGKSWVLNVATQTWTSFGPAPALGGATTQLAPGKIIASGGGTPPLGSTVPLQRATWVVDMNQATPSWRQVGAMASGRFQHNLVTLPDGSVLAIGGADRYDLGSTTGILGAERWDPATETWATAGTITDMRNYHSTALLLPDGRVISAGGGNVGPVFRSGQIYSPPYLFKGARPTITGVPASAGYGATIAVQTPDAASISSVVLVGMGAVTHTYNMNAQRVPLAFTASAGALSVQIPANGNLAPPGRYMLFVINAQGIPSVAATLSLGGAPADTTPPTVGMTAPANGATVAGTAVTVAASASDNVGVTSVQFLLDGALLGAPVTTAPYTLTWDSTTVANGSHTLSARAQDAAGNVGIAVAQSVTVANADTTPPVISGVAATNAQSTSAVVTWTTNEPASSRVEYGTTTSYGASTALDLALVTGHSQQLTGLLPATTYNYRVVSTDAAGNGATSGNFVFTTASAPDTQPPTVALTAPANGATLSGAGVTLSATASDNVGVVSVQFLLDGAPLGGPVTAAPYTITWDTTAVANGGHTLGAQASDAAGNTGVASTVAITVANADTTPPAITGVTATNLSSVGATITWTTNEPATSQVDYGTTMAYGASSPFASALVGAHSVALTGLSPATTYHYRVQSADGSGNMSLSGDFTFTTFAAAPLLLVGDPTIEVQRDSNPSGTAEAFQYTVATSGSVTRLYIYLDSTSTATTVIVGLYTNTATNNPGVLLTQGTIANPVKGAWNAVVVPSVNVTSGTPLWIAILGPKGAGTVRFRDSAAGGRAQTSEQATLLALPAAWTPGTNYTDSPASIYATQEP